MKKLSLIVIAVTFVSLVACTKDRTCTCTETTKTTSGSPAVTTNSPTTYKTVTNYTKVKKSEVRDQCAGGVATTTTVNGNNQVVIETTTSCELAK